MSFLHYLSLDMLFCSYHQFTLHYRNMLEDERQRKLEAEAAALEALEEEKRVKAEKEAGGVSVEPEATPGVYNAGARIAARMGQAPKPQERCVCFVALLFELFSDVGGV